MDRSNLKDQEKPPTAPPRPHHSITTGPTQLPPSPNTRQPAQPSAVTASPTIRPSPQATPKDTSHLGCENENVFLLRCHFIERTAIEVATSLDGGSDRDPACAA